jgi:lipopolysaccharide/colanic/teichoic acid biosynthesis glycosyltransferase
LANVTNDAKVLDRRSYYAHPIVERLETNRRGYFAAKRFMDIIGACLGLILCFPLFVAVALLIKLEDWRGPILFSQTRVGKDGREFKMYKFRSMVSNAEAMLPELLHKNEVSGLMFKMKEDPRVTRIGKWIRRTSIDELPQLINVLKGEMSLVGPRPPLQWEVGNYTTYHFQRLKVIPGCTGLWQISGRNHIGFNEMVELDLKYIDNRTLLFDLKIILKTFTVLFGSKGAF